MEAGKYGLTCGTCFVARRLEVVAVVGLLWISWSVLRAAGFFCVFFPRFSFFERTQSAASMRPPCLLYFSTSIMRQFFAFKEKKPLHTGVRTGCYYLISLSACLSVYRCICNICDFY